jgi:arsenite methyltransferase
MPESITGGKRFMNPETVVSHFHIREGDIVADYGAGGGFYIEALSTQVGETGRVYACEIQKELIEKIGNLARIKGIHNVHPLWCDMEMTGGLKIESETVDIGLLINTLFQIDDKKAALREISRTLRSGGKLCVIDWSDSFGGVGPQVDQVVTEEDTRAYIESVGFVYENSFDAADHHYGLTFRKI